MALPLIPIAVAAGLGVLYLVTRPSASSAQATAAAKAKAASASAAAGPSTFPPELQGELDRLLNPPADQDPAALDTVATRLEGLGFKEQATALRLKAAQLRAAQGGVAPPAPPAPPQPPPAPGQPPPSPSPTTFVPGEITPLISNLPPIPSGPAAVAPSLAVITTTNAPPLGDLIVRSSPSASAEQIGGAEKGGMVTVVNSNASGDGVFAEIIWPGGVRWPAVHGFAKNAFLRPV
jgi:hypothetical protein